MPIAEIIAASIGLAIEGYNLYENYQDEQKAEDLAGKRKLRAGVESQNMMQQQAMNPYAASFSKGGKVVKPGRMEMLPANQDAVNYNNFFEPISLQLEKLQRAAESNSNMKTALGAAMGTRDLYDYKDAPAMTNLLGKKIPPMNKQSKRVQGFINSLSDEQIAALGKKYPKSGLQDKLDYVKSLKLTPKQALGALDAWSFKNRNKFPYGGQVGNMTPVELEKQEVFQTPNGQMGQVDFPSHSQGGGDMQLPAGSFVWSDKLRASTGRTFAEEAAYLGKQKAKYEKILNS